MAKMKKQGIYSGGGSEKDFNYDPEGKDDKDTAKLRLPFALCKANGIEIQDWWTPRDAWNALKQNGEVDDVSEEYADFYRKMKREHDKEKRKERKERAEAKKKQKADPEHVPDENYQHKQNAISGADKGKPMTFEEADNGHCNPYYGKGLIGYKTNCQTCVAVYVARRLGYDVRALPNLDNKAIYNLSHNTSLAFVDEKGNHPDYLSPAWRQGSADFIEKTVQPGKIYSVEFGWKGRRSGHIITAERGADGKVRFYDPQTNETHTDIRAYLKKTKGVQLMDLTNARMDESFCDKIMKKA